MPGTTYKPLGPELSIASAIVVRSNFEANGSPLIRVFNSSGSAQVLTLVGTSGQYANITIGASQEAVIKKAPGDTVQMASGLAVPIAYQYNKDTLFLNTPKHQRTVIWRKRRNWEEDLVLCTFGTIENTEDFI